MKKLFLLLLLSNAAMAENDCPAVLKDEYRIENCDFKVLAHYRQKAFNPDDLLGDYAILKSFTYRTHQKVNFIHSKSMAIEMDNLIYSAENKKLAQDVLGLSSTPDLIYAEDIADFDNEKLEKELAKSNLDSEFKDELFNNPNLIALTGKKSPINVNGTVKMLTQVISEEIIKKEGSCQSYEPTIGELPKWSKKVSSITTLKNMLIIAFIPKLLIGLALGETTTYMFVGKENELKDWIHSQKNRSVTFENIFRKSYQLNCGNISKSLFTILNALSENFRSSDRERLLLTNKLSPIINHLGNGTDNFGPWYHFFGLMIYGYHYNVASGEVMALIERGTALFYNEVDEAQENKMRRALRVGSQLRRIIKKKKYLHHQNRPQLLQRENYLNLNEDFTKSLNRIKK